MQTLVEAFKEGGLFMFIMLFLFAASIPVALLALALRNKLLSTLVLVSAVLIFCLGLLGTGLGIRATNAALGNVPEEQQEMLMNQGKKEAMHNVTFGSFFAITLGVFGVGALILERRKNQTRATGPNSSD
jgi:hypothetical protein